MGALKRFSIGTKLTVGFGLVFAVIIGSSIWTYFLVTGLQREYTQLMERSYPLGIAAKQLQVETMTQAQAIMAFAATLEPAYIENISTSVTQSDELLNRLQEAMAGDAEGETRVQEIQQQSERFRTMIQRAVDISDHVGTVQRIQIADDARNIGSRLGEQIEGLIQHQQARTAVASQAVERSAQRAVQVLLLLSLVMLGVGLAIGVTVYRGIATPLRSLSERLRVIASGRADLTQEVPVTSGDEVGQLADSFNQLVRGIREIVQQMMQASHEVYNRSVSVQQTTAAVAAASQQVVGAVNEVAAGAQRQSYTAGQVNATIGELASAIGQIAHGAQRQVQEVSSAHTLVSRMVEAMEQVAQSTESVTEASAVAAEAASKGDYLISTHLNDLSRVRDQVVQGAEHVKELGESSTRIVDIVQVMTDIASRTNLLALNAAIEAARAGEHGRGFAVVAEEVRELAQRSATSAKEIRTLVQRIELATIQAIRAMEQSTRDVEQGVKTGMETGNALRAILDNVTGSVNTVRCIADLASEVRSYSDKVAQAISQMHLVTQDNTAATEQMAAAADTVTQQVGDVAEISESNSASVEEVAASMEEMDRSVSNIAAAAHDLAVIAEKVNALVGQFRV